MTDVADDNGEELSQMVTAFWESFPPYWHRVRAHIRQIAVEQYDISVEQFHLLRHIRRGYTSVSELAEVKQISRAAVSQAMNALVDKNLVQRQRDPDDRRRVHLTLTGAGEALLDVMFADTRQWMMETLAPLTRQDLETLRQGMEMLKKIDAV